MKGKQHPSFFRRAFALLELPFAICILLALAGVVAGALLWYRSGYVTTGSWAGFSLVLPLGVMLLFLFSADWRHRRREK